MFVAHEFSCMWNLPGPGIELVSPALSGGFLTTGTLGSTIVILIPQFVNVGVSLVAQLVKNPPAVWEIWVQSLGWDSKEKGMATYPGILAWRISWTV